jgi:hypothetical protein
LEADVEGDTPSDLAGIALLHHRRHRRLTAHSDQRDAFRAGLDRFG